MKQLGVAIWCVALTVFVAQFFQTPKSDTYVVILCIALFVNLPLLIYSWLWGPQRGHFAHFMGIVVAAYLSILLYFRESIPVLLLGVGVAAALLTLYLVVRKYRPGFVSDVRHRIRRDHFARKA
jgi:hypothetical protein